MLGCGPSSSVRDSIKLPPEKAPASEQSLDSSRSNLTGEYEYRDIMNDISLTVTQIGDTLIQFKLQLSCHAANLEKTFQGTASCSYCGQGLESDVDVNGYLYFVKEFFFEQDSCSLAIRMDIDEHERVRLLADRCLEGDERLCDKFNDVVLIRKPLR
jgi:hypothetical protein